MTQKPRNHRPRRRLIAIGITIVAVGAALGVAACSGGEGSDLPDGVAARVGDTPITYAALERVMDQSRATAEAQGQSFPEKGTKEYTDAQRDALRSLVNIKVVQSEARLCGKPCLVTPKDLDKQFDEIIKSQFEGKRAELVKFLRERRMTMGEARQQVRANMEQTKIQEHVTRGVRFTPADAQKYYNQNRAQFRVEATREVSHILVEKKAEAERLAAQANPQNFAQLARQHSIDTGSKPNGGDLGAMQRGAFVPEFEKAAFALKQGEVSKPVRSQFGWHLILVTRVTPARTIPFAEARQGIIQQQLQAERDTTFQDWVTETLKKWEERTVYANSDLKPPAEEEAPVDPADPGADPQVDPSEQVPVEPTP